MFFPSHWPNLVVHSWEKDTIEWDRGHFPLGGPSGVESESEDAGNDQGDGVLSDDNQPRRNIAVRTTTNGYEDEDEEGEDEETGFSAFQYPQHVADFDHDDNDFDHDDNDLEFDDGEDHDSFPHSSQYVPGNVSGVGRLRQIVGTDDEEDEAGHAGPSNERNQYVPTRRVRSYGYSLLEHEDEEEEED